MKCLIKYDSKWCLASNQSCTWEFLKWNSFVSMNLLMSNHSNMNRSMLNQWILNHSMLINEYWINRCSKNERQTRLDADDKTWVEKAEFSTKIRWSFDSKIISTRDYLDWQKFSCLMNQWVLNRSNLNHSSRISEYWITRWWIKEYWINRRRENERQMRLDADDKTWEEKEKFFTKVRWSSDSKFISTHDYIKWQILLRYAFSLIGRSGFLVDCDFSVINSICYTCAGDRR
jgi:hypothetical protein